VIKRKMSNWKLKRAQHRAARRAQSRVRRLQEFVERLALPVGEHGAGRVGCVARAATVPKSVHDRAQQTPAAAAHEVCVAVIHLVGLRATPDADAVRGRRVCVR